MEFIKLNNGIDMPLLGFGVYQIAPENCEQCVLDAIETGYRLIDTAAAYMNEQAVGAAIRRSRVARGELFVTTKLWIQDAGYDGTKRAFYRSLDRLGLEYLDLYLVHKPLGDYYGAWRALEELYKEGVIRAIGVCNFSPDRLVDLIHHNEIVPMINQIETHVFWQRDEYQRLMQTKGVQHQSWGTFVEGRNGFFQNEILREIGEAHHKSIAQVALRWLTQRGVVCIPKSTHKERMAENFKIFDFKLSAEEMERIKSLDLDTTAFYSHENPNDVERLNNIRYDI